MCHNGTRFTGNITGQSCSWTVLQVPRSLIPAYRLAVCGIRYAQGERIWQGFFHRSIGTSLPRPFFLPKPLAECSAQDLENELRRWEVGWVPQDPLPSSKRRVIASTLGGRHAKMSTVFLLPGGRWLISGYADGSLWCFDLSGHPKERILPMPLLPSPFAGTEHSGGDTQIQVSIDFTSQDALGSSAHTHHLAQFNIAVLACPKRYEFAHTQVDVWRVHVLNGVGGEGLKLGAHLSSFMETPTSGLLNCSLHGPSIAYTVRGIPARSVIVVDWADAKSKTMDFQRYHLPGLTTTVGAYRRIRCNIALTSYHTRRCTSFQGTCCLQSTTTGKPRCTTGAPTVHYQLIALADNHFTT